MNSGQLRLKEREVTRQVRDYLQWHKWRALRNQSAVSTNQAGGVFRSGEKGMPDYLFLYYFQHQPYAGTCVHLWVEVKREGQPLDPAQIKWQVEEIARGGIVWTVDSYERFVKRYQLVFGWLDAMREGQLVLGDRDDPGNPWPHGLGDAPPDSEDD